MVNLYGTADRIGEISGGGVVTWHELEALRSLGDTVALGFEDLVSFRGTTTPPWIFDEAAEHKISEILSKEEGKFRLAHFYSGTFTRTVRLLKQHGIPVSYSASAHDPKVSQEEHEKLGIPYDYPHLTDPDLWKKYIEGYQKADFVICPSSVSSDLMKTFGCMNVAIIPYGVNPPNEVRPFPKRFTVGYLGQVGPDKGLIYLLLAWKRLMWKDAVLVLAGRHVSDFLSLTRLYGGGNIEIRGFVPDIWDFYGGISVYCQPSVTEGFGIEILEAMAAGRPVVASAGAGAAEHVEQSTAGYVVPIRDPDAIAGALEKLRSSPNLSYWGKAGRSTALFLTWSRVKEMYQALWDRVL